MKYNIFIYFYLVLSVGILAKDTKIIGGSDVPDVREFSYEVSLRHVSENIIFCGGVIISPKHILTAAHCLLSYERSYAVVRIYTVRTSPTSVTGPSFKIDKVFMHPGFTGQMIRSSMGINDISVIKIVEIIEFNEFQNKIDLPTENIRYGVDCIMSGWGTITYQQITKPITLQKAKMTILNPTTCSQFIPFLLHPCHLCGYDKVGVGSCTGDSGGPLVFNNKIAGITSFSLPCALGYPDIFTNVYFYLDFITFAMSN